MNRQFSVIATVLVVAVSTLGFLIYKGLGQGLRFVPESEPCTSSGCFEGIMHFTYLYDGPRKVARVGQRSISPSGAYAAFEGATSQDSGKIILYNKASGELTNITDGRFAIPQTFQWDEQHSKLVITYYQENPAPIYSKHLPSTVRLR